MRQLSVQRAFIDPARELAMNTDSRTVELDQLLMLAIEQALAPPIVHRRNTFQPMRVIVVDHEVISQSHATDGIGREMPLLLPRAIPYPPQHPNHPASQVYQRAVRGEILSDESGRLFEKLGHQIRPLHQLASGPFGEVIDLVPSEQPRPPMIGPPSAPRIVKSPEIAKSASRPEETAVGNGNSQTSKFVPLQQSTEQHDSVNHRKLFADPGQWRVLWWGEFKEILAPQLAHPERLRDTYRLPCYVQVIETERTVSVAELAAICKSEKENHNRLFLLTDDIAEKLDLVLPLRPAPPLNVRRQPNTLLPHERVFRLIVANDPTFDIANQKKKVETPTPNRETLSSEMPESKPASSLVAHKSAIPGQFIKEWEFKISREEASYDMNAKPTLGSLVLSFFRRMRFVKRRNELHKWQTLLAGKDADEQLWAVRPPTGTLRDSVVRDWAAKTLELGGYDSRKMMIEWEILWRRKGL
jgi:hypothetical protein